MQADSLERLRCSAALATAFALSSSDIVPGWPSPGHGVNSSSRRVSETARTAWRSPGSNSTSSPGSPGTTSPAGVVISASPLRTETHARSWTW